MSISICHLASIRGQGGLYNCPQKLKKQEATSRRYCEYSLRSLVSLIIEVIDLVRLNVMQLIVAFSVIAKHIPASEPLCLYYCLVSLQAMDFITLRKGGYHAKTPSCGEFWTSLVRWTWRTVGLSGFSRATYWWTTRSRTRSSRTPTAPRQTSSPRQHAAWKLH